MAFDHASFLRAAFDGDAAFVSRCIADGADVNRPNAKGMTPLMMAAWQHDRDQVARILLDHGADLTARQPSSGWSAATFAAVNSGPRCLALFFERGHRLDPVADWKALMFAVQYRSRVTATMLLDSGFPPDPRDEEGRTPLMRACRNADTELVRVLLDHGADPRATDHAGWTALHFAAEKANPDNARALMAHGAQADAPAHDGRTPLDLATEKRRAKLVAVLRG